MYSLYYKPTGTDYELLHAIFDNASEAIRVARLLASNGFIIELREFY